MRAAGRRDARIRVNMSGQPRPEQNDPPGMFTVRLTYDDFKDAPPVGVPVALVGYAADDTIAYAAQQSDKEGRAQFTKLDRSGATAYFAMAQLPRGNGRSIGSSRCRPCSTRAPACG